MLKPISILAGGGVLPRDVAEVLRSTGHAVNIVALAGMADADFTGFPVTTASIGQTGRILRGLRANGAREMVFAGYTRRPDLRSLAIDWVFVRHIFTILSLKRGGDDQVLRRIAAFFERYGLTIRGIGDVAPSLLTPGGALTGALGEDGLTAAAAGLELVHRAGPFDVGQALCIEGDQVIAIEAAEGTNGLISRLPPAAPEGRPRLLVKAAKPGQDLRVDLPTIGSETVAKCAEAGVSAIVLEAGRSLIAARDETLRAAKAAGIAIVGITPRPDASTAACRPHSIPAVGRLVSHGRVPPKRQFRRDATKGLQLLAAIGGRAQATAAIVARENVFAINVGEPLDAFIRRTEGLAQWGDRRERRKRDRTLVLASGASLRDEDYDSLDDTKIAGIALLDIAAAPAARDRLVAYADRENAFVVSPS